MLVIVISIIVLVTLILVFGLRPRRLKGPMNADQENNMPVHLKRTDHNKLKVHIYLAAWIISKKTRGNEHKIDFLTRYFKEHFGLSEVELTGELTSALKHTTNIRSIANWIVRRMPEAKERVEIFAFLLDISFSDGDIIDREYVALCRFGSLTGIRQSFVDKEIFARRKVLYESETPPDFTFNDQLSRRRALIVLDLMETAGLKEIKQAYRQLAHQYHPDRFEQADEDEQQAAAEKFLEIRRAYDFLVSGAKS